MFEVYVKYEKVTYNGIVKTRKVAISRQMDLQIKNYRTQFQYQSKEPSSEETQNKSYLSHGFEFNYWLKAFTFDCKIPVPSRIVVAR